jgi:hypothetical protein
MNFRFDADFADFVEYNDLGLPLAFAMDNKIVDESVRSIAFINETWDLFLASLGAEDSGYENLDDLLTSVEE